MSTPVTNWGKATVSAGYDAAATSIVLTTGHGSRFPATFPYPLTWWNATDYPDPADDPNREIVTVTNRSGDTLTVTRGAELFGASTKNTGGKTYKMLLGITKAMWDALALIGSAETFKNLLLSTHPDADLSASRVYLNHADWIVMSDGERVTDWNDLVANITGANGIGALDTGSEASDTWYSVYAGYNGTTKGLFLHREKDYFLDEQYTTGEDATQGIRSNVDNSTVKVAQGFGTLNSSGLCEFVDVKLIRVSSPTGRIWFTIEADSGGVPSNTPLATSDKLDVSRLTASAQWVRIPFRTPATLSTATTYHLVAQGDWTVSGTNYVGWRMDGSAGSYAAGSKALYDSDTGTWTADGDDDLMFKIYITRNDVAVSGTAPTGYRYAKIGYVYNDGADFGLFAQHDRDWAWRSVGTNALIVNEASGATTLLDLRNLVPPQDSLVFKCAVTATGAAPASAAIADINGTDMLTSDVSRQMVMSRHDSTGETLGTYAELPIQYSAIVADITSGADFYGLGFRW